MEDTPARNHLKDSSSSGGSDTGGTDVTWPSTDPEANSTRSDASFQRDPRAATGFFGCYKSHEVSPARKCPAAQLEFSKIATAYPRLRSTGCTEKFCQSGRMVKTNEPRVGRDVPVYELQAEAEDFLRQLRHGGFIDSDEKLHTRLQDVMDEIFSSAVISSHPDTDECRWRNDSLTPRIGGLWSQTIDELRHGLRLAWKHSQKCIMRSEYETLEVCDLRHVGTSQAMCTALVGAMREAFNNGKIRPTVFVFPPRQPGKRGPMFWNSQVLSFAAYEQENGVVLGDPANLQLTKDIIQLGWKPPRMRTRWDLLPIVAMAEGDGPVIYELTQSDFPLVHVLHPKYELQFEKLGLRWVPAPALSRLGFDIGGVQYTAAPFIGWFMDAEIGVRDLADASRYNVLPQVAEALGWIESEHEIDRLPEYEKLAVLSRAQTELNFAVYHSFKASGISMSDTLSASSMYCNYDDEHLLSKGFRLPSNPYWLAPPQGSIVPIWHRGGAPNYQPSPLICKHVQDPVKAWKREQQNQVADMNVEHRMESNLSSAPKASLSTLQSSDSEHVEKDCESETMPKIFICFCSAASTAKKLANDLHERLRNRIENRYHLQQVKPLNDLILRKVNARDTLLIIASTAGHGDVPLNGQRFLKALTEDESADHISFSIFANGSTVYGDRYNGAAKAIRNHLLDLKATPLGVDLYAGDTAMEEPPWTRFEEWFQRLMEAFQLEPRLGKAPSQQQSASRTTDCRAIVSTFSTAKLVACSRTHPSGIQHVVLDIGGKHYDPLSHVSVLVPNNSSVVKRALRTIGLDGKELVWDDQRPNLTVNEFLSAFVDFEKQFSNIEWAECWSLCDSKKRLLETLPVREALQAFAWPCRGKVAIQDLLTAMPLKTPRKFSAASSQELLQSRGRSRDLELLIQHRQNGLVSNFLRAARPGACVRLETSPLDDAKLLKRIAGPIICFATGSGLAPVLSLLQHRLASGLLSPIRRDTSDVQYSVAQEAGHEQDAVTLILGFRGSDSEIISQALVEPLQRGVVDMLLTTPSNDHKLRAQDRVFESNVRRRIEEKLKYEGAAVLVCALPEAAEAFARNLSAIVGCNIKETLGDRYIEEVYKPAR